MMDDAKCDDVISSRTFEDHVRRKILSCDDMNLYCTVELECTTGFYRYTGTSTVAPFPHNIIRHHRYNVVQGGFQCLNHQVTVSSVDGNVV